MKTTGYIVALISIFNMLLLGCYSSRLIEPTGKEMDKVYSGRIKSVVTKDCTRFEFSEPPEIVNESIIGDANGRRVSVPISDLAIVRVEELDWTGPTLFAGFVVFPMAVIGFAIAYHNVVK